MQLPDHIDQTKTSKKISPKNGDEQNHHEFGRAFVTTNKKSFFEWARLWGQSNSLWPFPFGTACCALEYSSVVGAKYDIGRFDLEFDRIPAEQSDLLIIGGTITEKLAPMVVELYEKMRSPKWVIAFGACASSGGPYRAYNVVQGISQLIPVDVYIPGCPPTPESLLQGIFPIKEKIKLGQ